MLPSFHWIIPGQLAGSGQPGYHQSLNLDLAHLETLNLLTVVTLTEDPLPIAELPQIHGFTFIHFPIVDMKAPTGAVPVEKLCRRVQAQIDAEQAALFHCREGTGRTGTLLACQRVYQGLSAEEAIAELRKIEPLYVRNSLQENFVATFANYMAVKRSALS